MLDRLQIVHWCSVYGKAAVDWCTMYMVLLLLATSETIRAVAHWVLGGEAQVRVSGSNLKRRAKPKQIQCRKCNVFSRPSATPKLVQVKCVRPAEQI